ncbi:DUF4893 domain-containing protein [Paracoccus tegillarcae]|nr:DUF4893 domain-containing protein [Paracoccus tegillarcae]
MYRIQSLITALATILATPALAQAPDSPAPASGDANPAAARAEEDAQRQMADGSVMRAEDLQRLLGLNSDLGLAMRQALAEGTTEDLEQLSTALRGKPMPPADALAAMPGEWSCQTIKVGGMPALTVYSPFSCVIDERGNLQKLSGSQRTRGKIQEWEGQLVYLGTAYVADQTPPPYAEFPETVDTMNVGLQSPDVGVVELTGANTGRIIHPSPYVESRLNILVLRR